jgi:hypothetical protein
MPSIDMESPMVSYLPVEPLDHMRPRIAQTAAIVKILTKSSVPAHVDGVSLYVGLQAVEVVAHTKLAGSATIRPRLVDRDGATLRVRHCIGFAGNVAGYESLSNSSTPGEPTPARRTHKKGRKSDGPHYAAFTAAGVTSALKAM